MRTKLRAITSAPRTKRFAALARRAADETRRVENMTDREMRKLGRAELLELLLEERRENERLRAQLRLASEKLTSNIIKMENAGSIAEAALQLSGVFEAAEAAAAQYLQSVRRLAEEQGK